jgi:hypothetical protein
MLDSGTQVLGIDFSGARDAGNKIWRIWIVSGVPDSQSLVVAKCG